LAAELPAILLWAIQGWKRLRENGRFTESESGEQVKSSMHEASSPILTFTKDCCVVSLDATASKDELYRAWDSWCAENDFDAGTKEIFARLLLTAVPNIKPYRPRVEGTRLNCYKGIAIRTDCPHSVYFDFSWALRTDDEVRGFVDSLASLLKESLN
jgi:putative DNA primase/helicase